MEMDWTRAVELLSRPLFHLGHTPFSLASLVQVVVLVALVVVASRLVRRQLRSRVLERTPLEPGMRDAIARLTGHAVLVLGLVVALQMIGVDLTALTVLAGALGVGIGFGLQNIVNNFVSGLIILTERPIKVGDRVEVGGTQGNVVRIGGRSTSIRTNDNIDLIIPNAEFISQRVVNLSYGDRKVRIRVPFSIATWCDPRQAEKVAVAVAAANDNVLRDPEPSVRFMGFGESSLDFELRAWTAELAHRPGLFRSQLYFALWEAFQENDIEIPNPQRDVTFLSPLRLDMPSGEG